MHEYFSSSINIVQVQFLCYILLTLCLIVRETCMPINEGKAYFQGVIFLFVFQYLNFFPPSFRCIRHFHISIPRQLPNLYCVYISLLPLHTNLLQHLKLSYDFPSVAGISRFFSFVLFLYFFVSPLFACYFSGPF